MNSTLKRWLIRLMGRIGNRAETSSASLAWEEEQRCRRKSSANNDKPEGEPRWVCTMENYWGYPGPG